MSEFWSWYIIGITVVTILACYWLIQFASRIPAGDAKSETDDTGHEWDGLKELNSPLPRWWLWMFYLTIVFAFIYLALYPGLGNYKGVWNWTSANEYQAEMDEANETYGPIFAAYAAKDFDTLIQDEEAMKSGHQIYMNYCALCHGSDAGGTPGFPSLKDEASLYGLGADSIKQSVMDGRRGNMPGFGAILGDSGVENVANYVLSLSGRKHDESKATVGMAQYMAMCAGCHMPDGSGMNMLGAPNLKDKTWIYGRSLGAIKKNISEGVSGVMPAHKDFLGHDKSYVVSAYIYSLNKK